jgi:hypothetical protein
MLLAALLLLLCQLLAGVPLPPFRLCVPGGAGDAFPLLQRGVISHTERGEKL